MENKEICLFTDKVQCCACGACMNICPKHAIVMEKDKNGFAYPKINRELCVGCGACKRVCAFQNVSEPKGAKEVYAAARKDADKIKKSTSGGIFAVFAEHIIQKKGIVYGACMIYENEKLLVKHIGVDNLDDLLKLQGSKYVQSDLSNVYLEVKQKLQDGFEVLFSGTPCQVAGLKAFLNKDYEKLLTIDIICHGVPNNELFQEHVGLMEKKMSGKIKEYQFRDKENGWGLKSKIVCETENGEKKAYQFTPAELSYYSLFLNGYIYRENCYHCKYTNEYRPADITIGDYWGVGDIHPEIITDNGGKLEKKLGISTIIVNTDKGLERLKEVMDEFNLYKSEFSKVSSRNPQLREPCKYPVVRDKIFLKYEKKGYEAVDKYSFILDRRSNFKQQIKEICKKILPKSLKDKLKSCMARKG